MTTRKRATGREKKKEKKKDVIVKEYIRKNN